MNRKDPKCPTTVLAAFSWKPNPTSNRLIWREPIYMTRRNDRIYSRCTLVTLNCVTGGSQPASCIRSLPVINHCSLLWWRHDATHANDYPIRLAYSPETAFSHEGSNRRFSLHTESHSSSHSIFSVSETIRNSMKLKRKARSVLKAVRNLVHLWFCTLRARRPTRQGLQPTL